MEEEKYVRTDEITNYIYKGLLAKGLVPASEEVEIIGDIVFDFLVHKGVLVEE